MVECSRVVCVSVVVCGGVLWCVVECSHVWCCVNILNGCGGVWWCVVVCGNVWWCRVEDGGVWCYMVCGCSMWGHVFVCGV